jgi:hypothetical protein
VKTGTWHHLGSNDGDKVGPGPGFPSFQPIFRQFSNIKWTKDRGQAPETAAWYNVFGGDRLHDHRLTIAE